MKDLTPICLSEGDFYIYVCQVSSGQCQLALKYRSGLGIKEDVVPCSDLKEVFTMEYVNRFRTSTDDDLGHMLENCLVVFEDSVERLKWEEVTSPCEDCRRNRMTSELLSRTSASLPSKGSKSNYVCLSGKYSVMHFRYRTSGSEYQSCIPGLFR